MERETVNKMVSLYQELKHLKLVGEELQIPWQTVYWWLKKEGVEVTGDKSRYGGIQDQIGLIGERLFREDCPRATDENSNKFQAKYDYTLGEIKIDVKTSFVRQTKGRIEGRIYPRWGFNCRTQQEADFIVCYCLDGEFDDYTVEHTLLIPNEMVRGMQTLSVTKGGSKWLDYSVSRDELKAFFEPF